MGFYSRFFIALLAVCVAPGAWAACTATPQSCSAGQYNLHDCQMGGVVPVSGYHCVACPVDYPESDAGNNTISDCYRSIDCSGESCKLYHDGQTVGSEHYHLEDLVCVGNTKSCTEFGWGIQVSGNGFNTVTNPINCQTQVGEAQWNGIKWNVSECRCDGESQVQSLKCQAKYSLRPVGQQQIVSSQNDFIVYFDNRENMDYYYCTNCVAGACPSDIHLNGEGLVCHNPGMQNEKYSVCACDDVAANYYSGGYSIPSNLSTNNITDCAISCGNGLTTNGQTGATNFAQCVPNTTAEYQDGTGRFVLGTEQCQP